MSKSKTKHRTLAVLDEFTGPMRGRGDVAIGLLVKEVLGFDQPTTTQVLNAIDLMKDDSRFIVTESGITSLARLVDDEPTPTSEPEDITAQATDSLGIESVMVDPATGIETPMPTGEAAPVATIGEQLAKAEEAQGAEAIELVETHELAPTALEIQRKADEDRAKAEKEQNEKRLASGIEALDNAILCITADLKEKKDRRKVLNSELMASILGHLQTSMDTEEDGDETDPEDTPIGQAISGTAPMIVEPPVAGMIRKMGAEMAIQGKTELDCPYSREKDARAVSMWFDGFREARRADHEERLAIKHGLTRDQMGDACLPCNGILPPGEECPRVATVLWDERRHLVLDMLADGEGPTAGQERWALLPLSTRDEWSSGEVCPAQTYGDPVAGAHADPEKEAKRRAGGIDCARLVKAGRSKLVVGPLALLSIAIVKTDQIAAANAAGEQPPH